MPLGFSGRTLLGAAGAATGITATGGTNTSIPGYPVHTFTSSGTFEITAGEGDVEYLVIAGGGSGGFLVAGGGGAGGYRTGTLTGLGSGSYTGTLGAGGAAGGAPRRR